LDNYKDFKKYNSKLRDHKVIETLLHELKAAIYFEEQTALIQAGEPLELETFLPNINQWVSYLSSMDAMEQDKRKALIRIIDKCSTVYNKSLGVTSMRRVTSHSSIQ